jgi:SAM-dependent methyltransferase
MSSQPQSFEELSELVVSHPENNEYKQKLVQQMTGMAFGGFSTDVKDVILRCLKTSELDHSGLLYPWWSTFEKDPDFVPLYKLGRKKNYKAFAKGFGKLKNQACIRDPFFILGISYLLIPDMPFEKMITYLRRSLLEGAESPEDLVLVRALARYSFHSEFILPVDEQEKDPLEQLRQKLGGKGPVSLYDLYLAGSYLPLYEFSNASELAGLAEDDDDKDALCELITDVLEERALRSDIPCLFPIEDKISAAVREQYEEFPYPRWKSLPSQVDTASLESFLGEDLYAYLLKDDLKILIAGCGTGRQALEYGIAFSKAEILAVDLSTASLSYVIRKQKEREITNVTFKQADILTLGGLGEEKFDFIVSTGVLHHMDDPFAGWQVLTDLLKPGGLMRIALYSAHARQFINRARQVIADKGYGHDADSIRNFRVQAEKLLKKKDYRQCLAASDYYSLSECRDMLFHVQEHQYTVPQLGDEISRLDLEFIRFELPPSTKQLYHAAFKDDPAERNLGNWDLFERRYPQTFMNMYRFWVQKDDGL